MWPGLPSHRVQACHTPPDVRRTYLSDLSAERYKTEVTNAGLVSCDWKSRRRLARRTKDALHSLVTLAICEKIFHGPFANHSIVAHMPWALHFKVFARAALSIWWALRTSVSCLPVNAALVFAQQ